jgi:O-antigen/teichoic acid export membrane protein
MINKLTSLWQKNLNLTLYLGSDILGKAITFVIPLLFAFLVDNQTYGVYSLSLVVVYLFSSLFSQAIQNPYIVLAQEEYRARGKSSRSFGAAFLFMILGLVLGAVGLFLSADVVRSFTHGESGQIWYIYIAFLGVAAKIFFDGLYISLDRKVLYGVFSVTGGGLGLLYFGIMAALGTASVSDVLMSLLVGNFFGGIILLPFADIKRVWPIELDRESISKLWKEVRWVALGVSAMYFINWGDNLVLRSFVGLAEIGIYNFAYQFFKAFILLSTSLVYFFLPSTVQKLDDKEYLKKYLMQTRFKIISLWLVINLLSGIAITVLINILYAKEYSQAIPVMWILLVASATLMYRRFYEPIFAAQKRFKFIHLVNFLFVAINLGLDVLLVPVWGINGAAIATAIAYTSLVLIYEYYYRKSVKASLGLL